MKVGVFFSLEKSSGGAYHQALKTVDILSKIKEINFSFFNIESNRDNFLSEKIRSYKTNLIDRFFFLFYSSEFSKTFIKKFNIKNRFENFIKKEKIDLIFFIGCSRVSIFCNNIDYISYIYEFHHIFRPDLPEYKGWNDFEFREQLISLNVRKSLSLVVDTKKKEKDLVKYYNCVEKKINVIPLTTNITNNILSPENIFSKEINNLLNSKQEFFFYPAQYWTHKNHHYILDAIKIIKDKFRKEIKFVFTGSKKNNFKNLNHLIEKLNLKDEILLLEYIQNNEIQALYKNCKALVMPSLVGYSSLPLYEAFYFEKPVFYTKNLLDESLKEFVNEIDIDDPNSLVNELICFDKNAERIEKKINIAKKYFIENLSENKISQLYKDFFLKIKNSRKIYE